MFSAEFISCGRCCFDPDDFVFERCDDFELCVLYIYIFFNLFYTQFYLHIIIVFFLIVLLIGRYLLLFDIICI